MTSNTVDFDSLLALAGGQGPWQVRRFLLQSLLVAAPGMAICTWAFVAFDSNLRCQTLGESCVKPRERAESIMWMKPADACNSHNYTFDSGTFDVDENHCYNHLIPEWQKGSFTFVGRCDQDADGLIQDTKVRQTSLVYELGLVCDRYYIKGLLGTTYMVGMLFGSPAVGAISDRYGRLTALTVSTFLMACSGVASAFAGSSAIAFGCLRFITGFGAVGLVVSNFVLLVETLDPKYTAVVGILFNIPWALGEMLLGVEVYLVRGWKELQLVAFAPMLALLGLYFLLDESPRWLMTRGEKDRSLDIMETIGKVNGKATRKDLEDLLDQEKPNGRSSDMPLMPRNEESVLKIMQSRSLLRRTLNLCYQWCGVTLCYYGLTFSSTNLSGDAYFSFMLNVFMEIPGYLFAVVFMDSWGRRPILVFLQAFSGASCIGAGLLHGMPDHSVLQLVLSLSGKLCSTAAFAIVYIYTAELFPTTTRSSTIGLCSMVARIGGILSMVIQDASSIWGPLPMIIMGGTALLAGILGAFLPETVGTQLPDTFAEAEELGSGRKKALCSCDFNLSPVFLYFKKGNARNVSLVA